MDLHQALAVVDVATNATLDLADPRYVREAAPIAMILVSPITIEAPDSPSGTRIKPIELPGGSHLEIPIPAWSVCILAVHAGFCLTGTDGESPDAHAGQVVIYRRRNRDSAMILVAGPDGCRATLLIAPALDRNHIRR